MELYCLSTLRPSAGRSILILHIFVVGTGIIQQPDPAVLFIFSNEYMYCFNSFRVIFQVIILKVILGIQ